MSEEFRKQQKEKFIEYLTKATDENALCTLHNTPLSECDDDLCEMLTVPKDKHERFDLYAQDVNEWAWVQEFVPGLIVRSAGGALPFQAEGYLGDFEWYFRAEDEYASLRVANDYEGLFPISAALYSSSIDTSEFEDTVEMVQKHWVGFLLSCIERLKKTEYLYHFECNAINYEASDVEYGLDVKRDSEGNVVSDTVVGWGYTADEAFAKAVDYTTFYNFYCVNSYEDMKNTNLHDIWERYENRLWSEEKLTHLLKLRDVRPVVVHVEGVEREYPENEPDFTVRVPEILRTDSGLINFNRVV